MAISPNTSLRRVMLTFVSIYRSAGWPAGALVGHAVVCGYDPLLGSLLDALAHGAPTSARDIVVVAGDGRPDSLPPTITWVSGEPTSQSVLERARIGAADLAIIVGSRPAERGHADARVVLTALAVRAATRHVSGRSKPLRVVGAISDPQHCQAAYTAGCDEVVELSTVNNLLLANSVARSVDRLHVLMRS